MMMTINRMAKTMITLNSPGRKIIPRLSPAPAAARPGHAGQAGDPPRKTAVKDMKKGKTPMGRAGHVLGREQKGGHPEQPRADGEHQLVDSVDVQAQVFGHLGVGAHGPDGLAIAGLGQEQEQQPHQGPAGDHRDHVHGDEAGGPRWSWWIGRPLRGLGLELNRSRIQRGPGRAEPQGGQEGGGLGRTQLPQAPVEDRRR